MAGVFTHKSRGGREYQSEAGEAQGLFPLGNAIRAVARDGLSGHGWPDGAVARGGVGAVLHGLVVGRQVGPGTDDVSGSRAESRAFISGAPGRAAADSQR